VLCLVAISEPAGQSTCLEIALAGQAAWTDAASGKAMVPGGTAPARENQDDAAMADSDTTQQTVADLVRRSAAANDALLRGDIAGYRAQITHADDFTLMSPFGGAPTHGFDQSPEGLAKLARFFQSGTARLEIVQSYATPDMVVLALIERQRAAVGGLPEQDWSLRVTLVFRRDQSEWRLVHRHADPLVHGVSLDQAALLARG
jgi:ketosteroid isomerase-like protein